MTESLSKALERLDKASTGWKGIARPSDLKLVLNELYRLRVDNLRNVLEANSREIHWGITLGHEDCSECEGLAVQAISYARVANSTSEQVVKSAFGGHSGSVRRV